MRDVIQTKSGEFMYIDTCYTSDHGWETMVFACDKNGEVTSWDDLDSEWYDTEEQALIGHADIVNKWKQK